MGKSKKRFPKSGARGPKGGRNQFTPKEEKIESIDMKNRPRSRDCYATEPNDWSWYAASPELVRDYASFQYCTAVGNQLHTKINNYGVPGIMVLPFQPTIGYAQGPTDPINVAMRNLYSWVRHANSGSANYDGPDLMMYILAMDSPQMWLEWMRRLYGIARSYTPYNRYYPRYLVEALGVDFDDLITNLADYRGYVNTYAIKVGAMAVPKSISYNARHKWMCKGLFVDSQTVRAQTYIYTPAYLYVLDEITDAHPATGLHYVNVRRNANMIPGAGMKVKDIIKIAEDILNPIIKNEDMNIMSGDILKAFGTENVVKCEQLSEDYLVLPEYIPEVNSQIENLTVLPSALFSNGVSGDVTQTTAVGTGYIVSKPTFAVSQELTGYTGTEGGLGLVEIVLDQFLSSPKVLNFHHDNVQPEEAMVATRLVQITSGKPVWSWSTDTKTLTGVFTLGHTGSEVIVPATVVVSTLQNGVWTPIALPFSAINTFNTGNSATAIAMLTRSALLESFDWHPTYHNIGLIVNGSTVYTTAAEALNIDFDNYTVIDSTNLDNMNLATMLSMFAVPEAGLLK